MRTTKKRYVKYELAGPLPYQQIGSFSGDIFDSLTPTDEYGAKSDLNSGIAGGLKGAGTGAAIGTAITPVVGTAIGAGVGAIGGIVSNITQNNKLQKQEQIAKAAKRKALLNNSRLALNNYDTIGHASGDIYAELGGSVPISDHITKGGVIKKLGDTNFEVEGNTHEEGGVKLPLQGVELEDNETITDDNYVFSDKLGFANRHKKIAKSMAKIEKRPPDQYTANSLELLNKKEEALKQEQEKVKQALGLGSPITSYAEGGLLGGPGDPNPYAKYFTKDSRELAGKYNAITDYGTITRDQYEDSQNNIDNYLDNIPLSSSLGAFGSMRKEFANDPTLNSVNIGEVDFSKIPESIINGKENYGFSNNSRVLGPVIYNREYKDITTPPELPDNYGVPIDNTPSNNPIGFKPNVRRVYKSDVGFGFKSKNRPGKVRTGYNRNGKLGFKQN